MTPTAIKAEAAKAGLKNISFPTQSVANLPINSGSRARVFAESPNPQAARGNASKWTRDVRNAG